MGQINTNNYPAVDSLADADLLIVENAIHGTGTTTPKQLKEKAIGTDPLETTAQTVTGAINELKDAIDSGAGGTGHTLAGVGKETSFTNSNIITDIEMYRTPKVGDILLVYFPDNCYNPGTLTVNVNGVATSISFEIISGDSYKGLCAFKIQTGLLNPIRITKLFVEDTLSGGTGISVMNNSIINTMPQYGYNIDGNDYTTAVTDGNLGSLSYACDYAILNFKASAQPDPTTNKYSFRIWRQSAYDNGVLTDIDGNIYSDAIPAGTTLICKLKDGGTGTSADPYLVTVLGIGSGGGADELNDLSDVNISSPSNGQVLGYNSTSGKWENNTALEVDASGNVTAGGNITDGQGNVLAEVSALEITQSGNPIAVKAVGIKAKDVVVTLEPIQSGSGDPSPSNIRPITGRTETSVVACGKNICKAVESGRYEGNGTKSSSSNRCRSDIQYVAAGTYTAKAYTTVSGKTIQTKLLVWANGTNGYNSVVSETNWGSAPSVTLSNNGYVSTMIRYSDDSNTDYTNISLQIEQGNTATAYEAYTENTATVTLGQTVYGGIVDFRTGKVTITHGIYTYTGEASEPWEMSNGTGWHQFYLTPAGTTNSADAITNEFEGMAISERGNKTGFILYNDKTYRFALKDSDISITSVADWKTWLSTHNLQICYKLATPTEITVSPATLALLSGYNYITADGNMEITLIPESILDEAKAYTDSALADKVENSVVGPVESGTTASRAYAVGEHFIRGGKFCTAIASIASGATLTQGTNYVEGSISQAIARACSYPSSEIEIGTWLGQRLYRKVIDTGTLPNATYKTVSTGLSNIKVVKMQGVAYRSDNQIPLPAINTNAQYNVALSVSGDGSIIYIESAQDRSAFTTSYVVLEYTKNS